MIKNKKLLYFSLTSLCLIFIATIIFLYANISGQDLQIGNDSLQKEFLNAPKQPTIENIFQESPKVSQLTNCQDLIDLVQTYNVFLVGKNTNNLKLSKSIAKFMSDSEFTNLNIAFNLNIFQSQMNNIKGQLEILERNQPAKNILQKLIKIRHKDNKNSKFITMINHLENQNLEAFQKEFQAIKNELPEPLIHLIEKEQIFQMAKITLSKISPTLNENQDVDSIKSPI